MIESARLILEFLGNVGKLPIKIIVVILNLFPTNRYELIGVHGHTESDRPDLRAIKAVLKGRRLHAGYWLMAYLDGCIVQRGMMDGSTPKGVYTEDYLRIRERWGL